MKQPKDWNKDRTNKDILFSKTVKAGKRVYYIDVKRDRRNELYISITESKRLREDQTDDRPVFEKHKIFLYREDMERFMSAMCSAADFAILHSPVPEYEHPMPDDMDWDCRPEEYFAEDERDGCARDYYDDGDVDGYGRSEYLGGRDKFNLDF